MFFFLNVRIYEQSFVFVSVKKIFFLNIEETGNMFASVEGNWETVGYRKEDALYTALWDLWNPLPFFPTF